jgi:hypothetical protein
VGRAVEMSFIEPEFTIAASFCFNNNRLAKAKIKTIDAFKDILRAVAHRDLYVHGDWTTAYGMVIFAELGEEVDLHVRFAIEPETVEAVMAGKDINEDYDDASRPQPYANAQFIAHACYVHTDLVTAAENVVACWSQGDLAGAVRELDAVVGRAKFDAANARGDGPQVGEIGQTEPRR